MSTGGYHVTRFAKEPRRDGVWRALWRHHFSRVVSPSDCVLDVGAGWGSFINQVVARRRIALDAWEGLPAQVAPGVEAVVAPLTKLDFLEEGSVDFAFASNVFEHVSQADFAAFLGQLRRKLSATGTLNIVQPNYRYCYREYFDDFTHTTVYSHVTLCDFLEAQGWEILECQPRFLPLTVKSRLPAWSFLIWLYLHSPLKPLGKQMLVRARPGRIAPGP